MTHKIYTIGDLVGLLLVGMLPYTENFQPDYATIKAVYHVDRLMVDLAIRKANGKVEIK